MKQFIVKIFNDYTEKKTRIYSSSAAFYISVSALPLLGILVFLLSCLSPALLGELKELLSHLIPSELLGEMSTILDGFQEKSASLVPFTVITALWSATKGVESLCLGVGVIFENKDTSTYILRKLKTLFRTFLFYLIILLSLALFAIGKLITAQSTIVKILVRLRSLAFTLLFALFLAAFYAHLSGTRVKNQIRGALFSATGWMIFTYFYSIYIGISLRSHSLYSEAGTIIFFLLWVYFCVNIIMLGAIINKMQKIPNSTNEQVGGPRIE